MKRDDVLSAIGEFYEAALDPDGMARFGETFRKATGVRSNLIFLSDHRTGRLERLIDVSGNFDDAARSDYEAHYHAINPWYRHARNRRPPYVARGQEMIAADALERSEFGADWCRRVGIFHMLGGVQAVDGEIVVASGIHRPRHEDPFNEADKQNYALILEHVGRALRFAVQLGLHRQREALSLDVIDRLDTGVMVIKSNGELAYANPIAERLFRGNRWFGCVRGRIRPIYSDDEARLAAELAAASRSSVNEMHGAPFVVRDPIEGPLLIQVLPFRPAAFPGGLAGAHALVMFRDPDRKTGVIPARLRDAFGLTTAEARLVAQLHDTQSLKDAAQSLGISEATARTQLKSVFAKTGFRRQGELLAAVGANPLFRR
jgi:DNA-binding CsgD family transcriptional regulator